MGSALAEVEPAVYRELPGFEKTHIDCETSAFSRVLRHRGLDPRILGDEWGYRFDPSLSFPLWAIRPARGWPARVLRHWYGVQTVAVDHADSDAVWDHLQTVVGQGEVSILGVDLFEWRLSTFHQRFHFPHRVVIADCRPDEALVLDGRGEKRHVLWMPRAELTVAMSTAALSDASHGAAEANRSIELRGGVPPGREQLRELSRAALQRNLSTYFGAPAADGVTPAGGRPAGEIVGGRALDEMLVRLQEFLDTTDEVAAKYVMPSVTFLGAMTSQWRLNSLFLELAAEHVDFDPLRYDRTFRALSRQWMKVYQIFLFGYHAGRSPHAMLRRLLERMRQMAQAERQALYALSDELGVRVDR